MKHDPAQPGTTRQPSYFSTRARPGFKVCEDPQCPWALHQPHHHEASWQPSEECLRDLQEIERATIRG